jgi:hypothetical protein
VNIDADSSQVDLLIHAVANTWSSIVVLAQLAMNRDPIAKLLRVHDGFPHSRRRGGYLD